MASPSLNIVNTLLKLASDALDTATENMAKANKIFKDEKEKRETLSGYRQDYVNNLKILLEKGLAKEMHMNYQNFLQLNQNRKVNIKFRKRLS